MKRWPLHTAHFWERAPFFRLLLPLIAGIVLYPCWQNSFNIILSIAVATCLAFLFAALYKRQNGLRKTIVSISLHIAIIALASAFCYLNDIRNNDNWFGNYINTADFFQARIVETPVEKEQTNKLKVEITAAVMPDTAIATTGPAFIYVYKDEISRPIYKGGNILVANKWRPIKNAGNPFEFNYARYCARNNIYYQQFVSYKDISASTKPNPFEVGYIDAAHDWSMHTLSKYIEDSISLGLIQSMLIGDEINLSDDTRRSFMETGIVHIIAISGGNIAILFLLITFMLAWIRNRKYKWLKYLVALPVIWLYVIMAGASPSAIRAAVMFSILAVGFIIQDRNDSNSLNQLFATALILLCAQPMWLYAIGFQLSFLAVLSLILFYRHVYRMYAPVNTLAKALWGTVAASITAEILVAPLVIYYFHSFPAMFIVSNVAAYLLLSAVLVLGMGILALSFIPVFAKALGLLVTTIVTLFNHIIEFFQQLEPISLHTLRLSSIELVLLYGMIVAFAVLLLQKKKFAAFAGLSTACLLLLSFCFNKYRDLKQERLVVYNLGKEKYIETIHGEKFSALTTDSLGKEKKEYAVLPAHVGWQSLRERYPMKSEIISIGNNTALVLKYPLSHAAETVTGIDYVVLDYSARLQDVKAIEAVLHPKALVLPYVMPEKQLNDWKAICQQESISLHTVQEGAFILEDW